MGTYLSISLIYASGVGYMVSLALFELSWINPMSAWFGICELNIYLYSLKSLITLPRFSIGFCNFSWVKIVRSTSLFLQKISKIGWNLWRKLSIFEKAQSMISDTCLSWVVYTSSSWIHVFGSRKTESAGSSQFSPTFSSHSSSASAYGLSSKCLLHLSKFLMCSSPVLNVFLRASQYSSFDGTT